MTGVDVVRQAVRLILVDPRDRVLLLHYKTPDTSEDFWCTPGGALDPGESETEGARREAREELGIDVDELGPCVATRMHRFRIGDGRLFEQHERFFLVRTARFEPDVSGLGDFERTAVVGHHWWSLDELGHPRTEEISPRALGVLVERLIREGTPRPRYDAGI